MDKKELKEVARRIDGKINEIAGELLDDEELQQEGREEQRDAVVQQTAERTRKVQENPASAKP